MNPKLCLFVSYLYQIAHLGDDDEEPEFSSAMPLEEGDTFFFQPRPLKNLVLVDEQENLSPIMSCQVCECVFCSQDSYIWKHFVLALKLGITDGKRGYKLAWEYRFLRMNHCLEECNIELLVL